MYKIQSLSVKNFKSYKRRQVFHFGNLNFLFGTNGSGKSTVLDALKYVNNIIKYKDQHYGFWGENRNRYFGGFSAVVSEKNTSDSISISIGMTYDNSTPLLSKSQMERMLSLGKEQGRISTREITPEYVEKKGEVFLCKPQWVELNDRLNEYDFCAEIRSSMPLKPQEFEVDLEVAKSEFSIGIKVGGIEYCHMKSVNQVIENKAGSDPLEMNVKINTNHPFISCDEEFFNAHVDAAILRERIAELNESYLQYTRGDEPRAADPMDWVGILVHSGASEIDFGLVENMYRSYQAKGSEGFEESFASVVTQYRDKERGDDFFVEQQETDIRRAEIFRHSLKEYVNLLGDEIQMFMIGDSLVDSIESYASLEDPVSRVCDREEIDQLCNLTNRKDCKKVPGENYRLLIDSISTPLKVIMETISKVIEVEEIRPVLPQNHLYGIISNSDNIGSIELWDSISNGDIPIEGVNMWLRELGEHIELEATKLMEINQRNEVIEDKDIIRIRDVLNNVMYSLPEMASGISQMLPVIFAGLYQERHIFMRQPELHLHPKNQLVLGDFLLESAFKNGNQLFIETHSEHIILRILRRITEQHEGIPYIKFPVDKDRISVFYVSKESGESIPMRQQITDEGDFSCDWPNGFFDERDTELF